MRRQLSRWLAVRAAVATGLLVIGRELDRLAQFQPFPQGRGMMVFAAVPGVLLFVLSLRELAASGVKRLAASGPYYAFRHPLELACQLLALGAALALASVGSILAVGPVGFGVWVSHALLVEEPALRRRFGEAYRLYRARTGLLLPSTYVWSRELVRVYYRLWCGLRIRGQREVPRSGPFFMVALHRCYMDPYLMSLGVARKLHYVATSVLFRHRFLAHYFSRLGCIPLVRSRADLRPMMAAFKILDAGGAVAMFPEGARSWYGEAACEPSVFKVLDKRAVPVVTVEIEGAFEHHPRFARRPRRLPIGLRYRCHPPGRSLQAVTDLVRSERLRDARLRALARPQPAGAAEQLLYVCPRCGSPFSCRGGPEGRVGCRACGTSFALLQGKGLADGDGVVSLQELEARNLEWAGAYRPEGLAIPGALVHRSAPANNGDLQGLHWLRRRDMGDLRPGSIELLPDRVKLPVGVEIPYSEIDSVLVESNWKVEISYRSNGSRRGYIVFVPPVRYAVFLQHFLRLRAFGNAYARYRGSHRRPIAAG